MDHGCDGFTWPHYFVPIVAALNLEAGSGAMVVLFSTLTFLTYVSSCAAARQAGVAPPTRGWRRGEGVGGQWGTQNPSS